MRTAAEVDAEYVHTAYEGRPDPRLLAVPDRVVKKLRALSKEWATAIEREKHEQAT